jgi:outer membrane protein TolC
MSVAAAPVPRRHRTAAIRPLVQGALVAMAAALAGTAGQAQTVSGPSRSGNPVPGALSFDDARARLDTVSDALGAADAAVANRRALSRATGHLRWPELSIEARELRYQKTLDLPVGTLGPVADAFHLPPSLRFEQRQWRLRPMLTAAVPLYTGGRIGAAQQAATAATRQADAEREAASSSLTVELVQAYFGQQLAERALAVRRDVRDGLQQHLTHAQALEQQGFATRAQRLQAVVARDQAEREYVRAASDLATARSALASLLHSDTDLAAATPLFVISQPLDGVDAFRRDALARHPQLARLRAVGDQARADLRVQRAQLLPELYAFGQYDLYRQNALLTDADWTVGLGLRFQLLSGSGRLDRVSAAREEAAQVDASLRDVARRIELGVTRAYNDLDAARSRFLLLESEIAQAEENVRLQELSFREGEATSLDVIDARLALGKARIDRAQAAYEFDLTLAQLLELAGETGRYGEYIRRADKVVDP